MIISTSESNLSTALSLDLREKLGITHIISVCPEYPSTVPNHLAIPVKDSEYEDLLIHLPTACRFIQLALDEGGKVLVHCVMGVSRSTTVVCAYLMWSRHLSASAALRLVKQRRPRVHPNYGFTKQLQAFAKCNYEPSTTNEAYREWKRKQERDVTNFINKILDTTPILPDQLFLSSDFPEDPEQAESLLLDLGMTHLLSLSPVRISSAVLTSVKHHHINIPSYSQEALLLALSDACKYIHTAIEGRGRILVHCLAESRACTVVCAYLMFSRHIPPGGAAAILEDALPLFNPTPNFSRHLDIFGACRYTPTANSPLVKEWLAEGNSALGKISNAPGAAAQVY